MPRSARPADSQALRQRKRHQRIADTILGNLGVAARRNHDVLLSCGTHFVRHRRGVAGCRQLGAPQFLARLDVECSKM